MTLNQLYREIRTALEGTITAATLDQLTGQLSRYASTVGWAAGAIDKDGRITDAFDQMRTAAKTLYEQTGEADMATLHDALADFILAIRSHDADMKPSSDNDDDDLY